jgi:hypothetical protein|tara:strand:- start:121614 stop:121805 length:192 start_codon:yes stop_codon:yes gene_type:complete
MNGVFLVIDYDQGNISSAENCEDRLISIENRLSITPPNEDADTITIEEYKNLVDQIYFSNKKR